MSSSKRFSSVDVRKLTYISILTALVVVLQLAGSFIRLGTFSVTLVLIPIVIGAALMGPLCGAWLGFVFGLVVLLSGDAALFLGINPFGTVVTVLLKGTLCGLVGGLVYKLFERFDKYVATMVAAVVCPLVNTGVFLLGSLVFFLDTIKEWAVGEGVGVGVYMFAFLVGFNFLFELLFNVVLAPVAVRLLNIKKKS